MSHDAAQAPSSPTMSEMMAGYQALPDAYDEMLSSGGEVREHWRPFVNELGDISIQEWAEHWETAQRLVQENGVTYNIADPSGDAVRPWRMDPIPMLLSPEEWRQVEAGLVQRARLLNAIVADTYGDQTLIATNQLPAPLVLGNPKFLRAVHGLQPPSGTFLNFIAFDIARGADHRWWVLNDRTQAPSGSGYALENRIVLGRSLANLFRDAQVVRLAAFFKAFSDHLVKQTGRDDPLIVIMTPGPYNETFFEHAYLARYLGFPLVEGADLTVRDNKVYLKTLNGLKQVHMIFRRVDDDFCDPLELRTDSMLGVAGQVAAARAGNVTIANALGSGIVECEAMMAFLPTLCRSLLGEDLQLPSLATWWCGQEHERDYVIENLDRLILRPTFSNNSILNPNTQEIDPTQLSPEERDALVAQLHRRGRDYFAQETLKLSTTPVWANNRLEPRPVVLRAFAVADGDGYRIMPGGLARTSDSKNPQSMSMQQGVASKDIWVLSESPVSTYSMLSSPSQSITLRRSGDDLASRVADNLFWLGRYAERTESSVRLIRSLILRIAGEAGSGDDGPSLTRLTNVLVDLGYIRREPAEQAVTGGIHAVEREIANLLFERDSPNGLLELLGNLERTASIVRDRLSGDSWRVLNQMFRDTRTRSGTARLDVDSAVDLLNQILENLSAFNGMQMENMTRSPGWRLLDCGRRIERSVHMAKTIRETTVDGEPGAEGRLDLLLELGDSTMTYRNRYLSSVQLPAVVDLLLIDETNPRSIAFQVQTLADHFNALPHDRNSATLNSQSYLVESMSSALRLTDIVGLCANVDRRGRRSKLEALLQLIENQSNDLSDIIARTFINHAMPTRSFERNVLRP